MKQTKLFHLLFPLILLAIPWIYLGIIWNELPQTIPTHFGISGEPDKFGAKNEIFIAPLIITVTGLLMYFILRNIHKIDPKKKYTATTSAVMKKLAVVIIILLCAASLFVIHSTLKGRIEGFPVLMCGMGLLLAYIGNLMHSIKPNYFAGIRVPWALENEENWRKTHQLASKIWFIGGIVLAIAALILNLQAIAVVFISAVLIMTLIPVIYSYNLYRKQSNTK